jgi:prepilin-type N-terminal cleavage/methylation domain-containing protein
MARKAAKERMPTYRAGRSSEPAGFTLLELTVVMILLLLVLGLVLPEASSLLTDSDLRTSARRLAGAVGEARNEAMLGGQIWQLVIDLESGSFWIAPAGEGKEADKPAPRKAKLVDDVRFIDIQKGQDELLTTGRVSIRFHPRGLVEPTVIHLIGPGNRVRTLSIKSFSGRLSIEDGYVGASEAAKG